MGDLGDIGGEVSHKMQVNEAIGAWAIVEEGNCPAVHGTLGAVRTHVWGVDLSGTTQGAGGGGGLVATVIHNGPNAGVYFPVYDGNGNVMGYVRASDGATVAQYEYGPFGELLRATGPLAQTFNHLFSTKYFDWETGLTYYGHRYYSPTPGRWPSRDPIGERGGNNIYGFVYNNPVSRIDRLGLQVSGGYPGVPFITKLETGITTEDFKRFEFLNCVMNGLFRNNFSFLNIKDKNNYPWIIHRTHSMDSDFLYKELNRGQTYVVESYEYYLANYNTAEKWNITNSKGQYGDRNIPGIKPTIKRESLYGDIIFAVITILHEPQHDFGQKGLGHRGSWDDMIQEYFGSSQSLAFKTRPIRRTCCGNKPVDTRWHEIICNCKLIVYGKESLNEK